MLNEMEQKEKVDRVERLITALDRAYHRPGLLVWRGFLIGLASGLGATIGAAIVLALLGFLLREFGGLPVIGNWLNSISNSLPTR
ncbi:hypothetical protein A3A71_03175 [Candidatus Berkelbacteria bacterium RIFCSPLOWO2_01_FULL_50_28]|uniref:Uncharacterized protein n=1 Tax=Candidatus Berkelbacteria bacterium RIFCSPLOWO2_01_FULL_50_28 TaxID=1797471 RepID=A0A1F5ECT4_9BACT|nr:MAG: hypothetical protein A2807_02740 [Candidatus Berkelbacteria bacterium RIFCSPHIGHO2_01_FULL_50_36]OGD63793.1 MAG: hypothetical protein A3F39_03575 [Candidatus Berkelbacteria bacterium RIFCSPHIGHO2_12_FULL_50_11]OGD65066.1 MAG: hypothetical protein A3A71_03175 [Candidatus Berkelbacteria bacterium RIFCSPLOWO2_01_FULL_50_28]